MSDGLALAASFLDEGDERSSQQQKCQRAVEVCTRPVLMKSQNLGPQTFDGLEFWASQA